MLTLKRTPTFFMQAQYVQKEGKAGNNVLNGSTLEQEILSKIEFFPIRCRIQNAKENFRKYQMVLQDDPNFWSSSEKLSSPPKMKVCCILSSR